MRCMKSMTSFSEDGLRSDIAEADEDVTTEKEQIFAYDEGKR